MCELSRSQVQGGGGTRRAGPDRGRARHRPRARRAPAARDRAAHEPRLRRACDPDEDDEPPRVDDQLARANGGTLLVKEIAHVGRGPQRKLLRVIRRPTHARAKRASASDERVLRRARRRRDRRRSRRARWPTSCSTPSCTSCSARCASSLPPLRGRPEDVPVLFERLDAPRRARSARTTSAFARRARTSGWPRTRGRATSPSSSRSRAGSCVRKRARPHRGRRRRGGAAAGRRARAARGPRVRGDGEAPSSRAARAHRRLSGRTTSTTRSSRASSGRCSSWCSRTPAATSSRPPRSSGLNRNTLRKKLAERNVAVSEPPPSRKK